MKLENLPKSKEMKAKKIVGRGPGSGMGKTSTHGQKGQKSRSGVSVSAWFQGGQSPLYRRLPKRGFTNINDRNYTEVTLTMLSKVKSENVTAQTLVDEGIIKKINDGIVILGTGKLDKKVNVTARRFTKSAKEKIEALGGKTEVI